MKNLSYLSVFVFMIGLCLLHACDIATKEDIIPENLSQLKLANDQYVTAINQSVALSVFSNDKFSNGATVKLGNPHYGNLSTDSGSVYYQPRPNYIGRDSLKYTVCEGLKCDSALVLITVKDSLSSVPCRMYATNDSVGILKGISVTIPVLNNDTLCGKVNLQVVNGPKQGLVRITPDFSFIYEPASGFTGKDEFSYQICDVSQQCASAKVYIEVRNDSIRNCADIFEAFADSTSIKVPTDTISNSILIYVLANDSLCDPYASVKIVRPPQTGNAVIEYNRIKYSTSLKTASSTTLRYSVCDTINSKLECREAEVYIKIN